MGRRNSKVRKTKGRKDGKKDRKIETQLVGKPERQKDIKIE